MGKRLDVALERITGVPISELRELPLSERRARVEETAGQPTEFPSLYPAIGRGNVIRDRAITHEEIIHRFDTAFRK